MHSIMKIVKTELLKKTKWVHVKETVYKDRFGTIKKWAYLERSGKTEAAVIIPIDKKQGKVLLIKQYRLPMEDYVIEFPAGLIDAGETPEETAERELLEETGFKGKILFRSPKLCTSAGLTNEIIYLVEMEIDSTGGKDSIQALDSSEDIEFFFIDIEGGRDRLSEFVKKEYIIDSKVWAFFSHPERAP